MFHFTDDCIIGITQIDDEHRHLFSLIEKGLTLLHNEYMADRYESVKALLEELEDYADQHFAHEEAYMEQIRDPELMRQRMQHTLFRDKIRDYIFMDINDESEQQRVLEDLMNFMAKWLYHHIIGSDIMIGKLPPLEEWMIRENPCEFSDEYLTGILLIDEEHRELFRIVEQAYQIVKSYSVADSYDEIMRILGELKDYASEHFHDEEEYMESIHYEGLDAQRRAHASFVYKLESIDLTKIDADPQRYMESLIEFLLGWLVQHILYTDKKIPNLTGI